MINEKNEFKAISQNQYENQDKVHSYNRIGCTMNIHRNEVHYKLKYDGYGACTIWNESGEKGFLWGVCVIDHAPKDIEEADTFLKEFIGE